MDEASCLNVVETPIDCERSTAGGVRFGYRADRGGC